MSDPEIDYVKVRLLASVQCTLEEIAAALEISYTTMKRMAAQNPELRTIMEQAQQVGKMALRRQQWRHASGFGPAAVQMSMWLGKQWLGQTDKSELEINGTVRLELDSRPADKLLQGVRADLLSPEELVLLAELADLIDERGMARLTNKERVTLFALVEKGSSDQMGDTANQPTPLLALPAPDKKAA